MAEDIRLDYLNAKKELDESLRKFQAIRDVIRNAMMGLMNPSSLAQEETIDIKYPAVPMGWKNSIPEEKWPTFNQFKECIVSLQQTYKKASQLYKKIPDTEKTNLTSPVATLQKVDLRTY